MDRREFLSAAGIGAVATVCVSCLSGCSQQSNPISPPTNVDFTLDLTSAANAALANDGGYVYSNGVIVARTSGGGYIAVSQQCTHQGANVVYRLPSNDFYCGAHGSKFSATGAVTQGPAGSPLGSYKTTLSGTSLRVQS
jgi:cytochrome b6-f complex iron-sulfur subunit